MAGTKDPSEHDFIMNFTSSNDETLSQDGTHQQLCQSADGKQGASIELAAKKGKWCYGTQDPRCQSIHSLQHWHICALVVNRIVGAGLLVSSARIISIYQPQQGQAKLAVENKEKGACADHPRPTLLLDMFVSCACLFSNLLPIVATRLEKGVIIRVCADFALRRFPCSQIHLRRHSLVPALSTASVSSASHIPTHEHGFEVSFSP